MVSELLLPCISCIYGFSTWWLVLVLLIPAVLYIKDQGQCVHHVVVWCGGQQLNEELTHVQDPLLFLSWPSAGFRGGQQLAKSFGHHLEGQGFEMTNKESLDNLSHLPI